MSSPRSERSRLRYGFTTGACAAAAALGAARMLREQRRIAAVDLPLPAGFTHRFALAGQQWSRQAARCFVVKDAGDDPDVTHGAEVHAEVRQVYVPRGSAGQAGVIIEGGIGVGRVTKKGLAVPVGEWAINPVPRQMIAEAVGKVFASSSRLFVPRVIVSIPDGEARARRTLNERLGIVGGLSILGTTGVVQPVSHRAWTETLEVALDVALAAAAPAVVLASGRTSEKAVQQSGAGLPREAFVMMGDYVGYALEACHRRGVPRVLLAVQFAKLAKIAQGHPQTHVRASRLDLTRLGAWARELGLDETLARRLECAHAAREIWERLGPGHPLVGEIAHRALARLRQWAPGTEVAVILVDYQGEVAGRFGASEALKEEEKGP